MQKLIDFTSFSCGLRRFPIIYRSYASKYTDTLNLSKSKFPAYIKKVQREKHDSEIFEKFIKPLYSWQRTNLRGNEFVLHDGPPYANGDVHMGHAVNKLLKDFVLRQQIVNGNRVHYRPGWDCHGLPIELKAKAFKDDMSPIEIRNNSRQFATETFEIQKKEFESWGVTADWNSSEGIYRTFDKDYIRNQLEVFYRLYEKKLIYRDLKPVYWSPSTRTALAEAELEYDPKHMSPSLFVRMRISKVSSLLEELIAKPLYALIWTTTPWTLPANQAICYNPELQYSIVRLTDSDDHYYLIADDLIVECGKSFELPTPIEKLFTFAGDALEQCQYVHPLTNEHNLPFLPANYVLADKGTGLVHTAPAHGFDDYLTSLKHKIPMKGMLDNYGKYNDDAPEFLRGKEVLVDGNRLVLEKIASDIIHLGKICHSYPIDWRTKKPVIVSATHQWFIRTDAIQDDAIKALRSVKFYPSSTNDGNQLESKVRSRPYWCVSRQRSWGTPIPAFYHRLTGKVIVTKEIIDHLNKILDADGTIDFWWTKSVKELIPDESLKQLNLSVDDIVKGQDILDIWFDSGVSWSYALDEPRVADLYLEGCDQFTGWFQSSLLTSVAARRIAPFKAILSHGFIVDANNKKMSKSIGNVVHPKDIIGVEGIDVLRYWVASHVIDQRSVSMKPHLVTHSAEQVTTIRKILKFLLGYVEGLPNPGSANIDIEYDKLTIFDKWCLNVLVQSHDKSQALAGNYKFSSYIVNTQALLFDKLSRIYLHASKDRLYCGKRDDCASTIQVIFAQFYVLSKMLWPIMPFMVEECWSYYSRGRPFYEVPTTSLPVEWQNPEYDECIDLTQEIRSSMLTTTKTPSYLWQRNVIIEADDQRIDALEKIHPSDGRRYNDSELCEILGVQSVQLLRKPSAEIGGAFAVKQTEIDGELCQRCRRFEVPVASEICSRCREVLDEFK